MDLQDADGHGVYLPIVQSLDSVNGKSNRKCRCCSIRSFAIEDPPRDSSRSHLRGFCYSGIERLIRNTRSVRTK
jgi:hypothetical protein